LISLHAPPFFRHYQGKRRLNDPKTALASEQIAYPLPQIVSRKGTGRVQAIMNNNANIATLLLRHLVNSVTFGIETMNP
jgi:hypothetical protein